MKYLLDTNVVSQMTRPLPHAVLEWVLRQEESTLYLSVATLLEIRYGVERKTTGKKRDELEAWLTVKLPTRFSGRIVPVEDHVADLAGRMIWRSEQNGWGMDEMDALIAATAMANELTLVTLNQKHFDKCGVPLVTF